MHIDATKLEHHTLLEGDICIVGAGAAGISIALALEATGKKVLLLESGGFEYDTATQLLNDGQNIGQKYFPLISSRLRMFGGTTAFWAGFCAPLDPIDFKKRAWVPYSGWPFDKSELDPYYEQAHEICALGPYRYEVSYWEKALQGARALPFEEGIIQTKIWQKSPPTRFGSTYKNQIIQSSNIHLYTHANVVDIGLNESGSRVMDLEVATLEGRRHQVRAKQFVLACGAIQNVRLLLASNKVMPTGVGNQNDLVGRFFMEHPHVDSAEIVLMQPNNLKLYLDSEVSKAFGMLTLSERQQAQHRLLNYSALITPSSYDFVSKDLVANRPKDTNVILKFIQRKDADAQSNTIPVEVKTSIYKLNTRIEQAPNPDSRVTLGMEKDALGIPYPKLNWQLSTLDKDTIRQANWTIGKEMGRLGIGRLRFRAWLLDKQPSWPDYLAGGYHHLGITRMHTDPRAGVVDAHCRVHGISNLFIAGSAVFPTSGTANPTLTIIALALRLAHYLKNN